MSGRSWTGVGGQASAVTWAGTARGALWLGLAVLAGLAFFRDGIADLWTAWQSPEYSHGPLIPLISGYLFLRHMKTVPPAPGPVADRWPGLLVLGIALLIGLIGNIAGIEKLVGFAIIIWVGGLILVSFGWARGRQFWPPVIHLAFMLPLPFFLYWQVSIFLQSVSSELGVALIQAMGIPVFLDGHIIDLGTYQLHVAEACSGLRYLFPIMSFTYIFAVLYRGPLWIKAVLLLSAIPIAILMNSARVGMIGIIVDGYGIEHAEGFSHFFEGWVVFLLCILAVLALARLMQWLTGDRRRFAEALDLDFSGLGAELARAGHVRPSAALIASTLAFAIAAVAWSPLTRPGQTEITREPFALFPRELAGWHGVQNPELAPDIAAVLRADDYLSKTFRNSGDAAPVDLFAAWYRDQTSGGIHSPEVCIPAGGWEMSEIESRDLVVQAGGQSVPLPVNRAVIRKGLDRQLVYYWFDQSGRRLTSDFAAKLWLLWDAAESGRTDGALIRLVTPIRPDETETQAEARLKAFLGEALPVLPRFIGR